MAASPVRGRGAHEDGGERPPESPPQEASSMTTPSRTKSHASRAADKAAGKENVVPISGGRSATGENDHTPKPDPKPAAAPKPELPEAKVDLGAYALTYHKPFITLPSGEVVKCPHSRWGHEEEKAAKACARKLASEHGVRIA
jgi:hypothetical protein